jgi:hypothetical protein
MDFHLNKLTYLDACVIFLFSCIHAGIQIETSSLMASLLTVSHALNFGQCTVAPLVSPPVAPALFSGPTQHVSRTAWVT